MNMKAAWLRRKELGAEVQNAYADAYDWDGSVKDAAKVATHERLRSELDALPNVYRIREDRKHEFVAAFGKIEKQCARIDKRLGLVIPRPEIIWGEDETVTTTNVDGPDYVTVFTYAEVKGDRPKAGGWEFVATLEHLEGGTLIRTMPGIDVDLSAYHNCPPACVHCNYSRKRNDTYVVRHQGGELKQVGSACLMDYTGGLDPQWCARAAEWKLLLDAACSEDESESGGSYGGPRAFSLEDMLTYTVAVVRERGWISSRDDYHTPTKSHIYDYAFPPRNVKREVWETEVIDEDKLTAAKVIEWAESLDSERSDFNHNVKLIARQPFVTARHFGILAYLPEGYRRSVETEIKAQVERETKGVTANSIWLGKEKDRITIVGKVTGDRVIEGQFGTTHIYEFVTEDGNVVKWFSSNDKDLELGQKVAVKGTVKKLDAWQGVKQTVLTRCAVTVTG